MEESKFYTCKYDRPFKEIFLNKKNEDMLKEMLEKIFKERIKTIDMEPTERNTGNLKVKRKTLDAFVTTEDKKIGIEVNSNNEDYVHPRNMSYISDTYSHQTLVSETYTEEIEIVQINLTYGLKDDKSCRVYYVQDDESKKFVENFKIYEINMDYYKKLWDNKNEEKIEENKIFVMLDLELKDLEKLSKNDGMVRKYMEELERINRNPEFREYMSAEEDARKIHNTYVKKGLEEGIKQGLAQGLEQGIKQGIKQGIEQGIEQGINNRNIEIAKNMFKDKIDIEVISKYTGLSIEKLEQILL